MMTELCARLLITLPGGKTSHFDSRPRSLTFLESHGAPLADTPGAYYKSGTGLVWDTIPAKEEQVRSVNARNSSRAPCVPHQRIPWRMPRTSVTSSPCPYSVMGLAMIVYVGEDSYGLSLVMQCYTMRFHSSIRH